MATYSTSNPPIEEDTTQEQDNSGFQTQNLELQKLLNKRKNKLSVINPIIASIYSRTDRIVASQIANEKEFYDNRGKYIKKGTYYHIHYTKNLNQHYMTGEEHSPTTKLIYRKDVNGSDFDYYNTLSKQGTFNIESKITIPTEEDYSKGSFTRYFAKKANETSSPAFEVSVDDFNTSPLYIFTSLKWYIKGDKSLVLKANNRQILLASTVIPNLKKLLSDYQYFRFSENLRPDDLVRRRLSISTQQTTTQQQTNTNSTAGGSNATAAGGAGMAGGGPPPGYSGG